MTDERIPAGLTLERAGYFTDAVFAIAMTLLVIEIPRPEDEPEFAVADGVGKAEASRNLIHFLYEQTGSFIAYVLAFFMLWIVWRQHHTLFDRIRRLSPGLVGWHFPLLLLIGFLPYGTTVYGHHTHNPAAAVLYALSDGGLLTCRSAVQSRAFRDGLLRDDVDVALFRWDARISWIVTVYWLATIVLCWWTPWVVIAWFATPVLAWVINQTFGRRRAAVAPA